MTTQNQTRGAIRSAIETLEGRQLMSVALNTISHVLTITGTSKADAITVDVKDGFVKVNDNGSAKSFAKASVGKIVVSAGSGNDQVTLTSNVYIPSALYSGSSSDPTGDRLQGGSGPDTIVLQGFASQGRGGAGNDQIYVAYGDTNVALGEGGNDLIKLTNPATYSGDNGFNGGTGTDTLDYGAIPFGVVLTNGKSGPYAFVDGKPVAVGDIDTVSGFENFTGGAGNDFITGTSGPNTLRGNGGNDNLAGGAGNDTLFGGSANDALFGEDGDDYLQGDAGNDFLSGGGGKDALHGNDGDDVFYSKDGIADFLAGGAGYDKATRDAIDVLNSIEAIS